VANLRLPTRPQRHQEDADLPEAADLVEPALGEDERRGAENSRVDVDHVLAAGNVHKHIDPVETEEAAVVKRPRDGVGCPADQTLVLLLPRHLYTWRFVKKMNHARFK